MKIVLTFRFSQDSERLFSAVEAMALSNARQVRFLFAPAKPGIVIAFDHPTTGQEAPIAGFAAFFRPDGSRDSDSSAAFTAVMQRAADDCYQDYTDAALRRSAACRAAAIARWANDE